MDKRVTFNKRYKMPYGTYVAYEMLPPLFPSSKIQTNKKSPSDWFDSDEKEKEGTLFFLITQHFNPDEEEMLLLNRFVSQGNYVFIASPNFDKVARDFFGLNIGDYNIFGNFSDSPKVQLVKPLFEKDTTYSYPGYSFNSRFINFDRSKFHVLGKDEKGMVNFARADVGKGSFYIHSDPFFFSNYFLLYKNNRSYFEKSLSLIQPSINKIIWDEYYLYKQEQNEQQKEEPSPLRVLLAITAFRWAFWLAVILLLLYLLLNMKRNQRIIPVVSKPRNESLDFVKIIGRLYFEKRDHHNLALKMVTYFLEHIRTRYFINTSALNDEFIKKLSGKSGYDEEKIKEIVQSIYAIQIADKISQEQLTKYYQQFQQFYKYIG